MLSTIVRMASHHPFLSCQDECGCTRLLKSFMFSLPYFVVLPVVCAFSSYFHFLIMRDFMYKRVSYSFYEELTKRPLTYVNLSELYEVWFYCF